MTTITTAGTGARSANVRLSTGIRAHFTEQGELGGEPIVCLHGLSDSSFSFSRLMPLLAGEGRRVLALDQRGHGDSERPESGYAIDDFASDTVALLDELGIERATIVGHSLGSISARRVAARFPDRVSRLVLIGAIATPVNSAVLDLEDAVEALEDPVPAVFVREFQESTIEHPVPQEFLERVVNESLKLPARVWRGVIAALVDFDDASDLGRIEAPTLLLWGEKDAYFPLEEQRTLEAGIPDARLVVYPGTGHAPHWERPERVAEDIARFLELR